MLVNVSKHHDVSVYVMFIANIAGDGIIVIILNSHYTTKDYTMFYS